MEFETVGMQRALAKWNHDHECVLLHLAEFGPHELDECYLAKQWLANAGWMIAAMAPAMTRDVVIPARDAAKRTTRELVAQQIEAELVCCDLYEQMNKTTPEQLGLTEREAAFLHPKDLARLLGLNYHAICHWGGYAAAIAREGVNHGTQEGGAEAP